MKSVTLYTPYRWRPNPTKLFRDIISPLLMVLVVLSFTKVGLTGDARFIPIAVSIFLLHPGTYSGYFWRKMWLAASIIGMLISLSGYWLVIILLPITMFIATVAWQLNSPRIRRYPTIIGEGYIFVPEPYDRQLPSLCLSSITPDPGSIRYGSLYRITHYVDGFPEKEFEARIFQCAHCGLYFEPVRGKWS
ncbi:MAG: hypothetical protein WC693_02305 [Patescibacteria group bacterium]|jgi:hypothetical protein